MSNYTNVFHFNNEEDMSDCFDHLAEIVEVVSTASLGADIKIDDDFMVIANTEQKIGASIQDAILKRFAPIRFKFNTQIRNQARTHN